MNYNYTAQIFPGQTINTIKSLEADVNFIKKSIVLNSTEDSYSFTEKRSMSNFLEVFTCKTWIDLINTFYSFFNIESENKNFWGFAELDRFSEKYKEKKSLLADYLGLPEEYCDVDCYSYVLVRLNNTIGTYDLNKEKEEEILDKCDKMVSEIDFAHNNKEKDKFKNIKTALNVLNEKIGTHLIKTVSVGESVFQVFVYDSEQFDIICESSKSQWSGISSMSFQFFTQKEYCLQVGLLKTLSGSDIFAEKKDKLEDRKYCMSKSIFMIPTQKELLECMNNIINVVPLKIGMSSCTTSSKSKAHDLLKGTSIQACIAKYGLECVGSAYYLNENKIDYADLYSEFCKQETLTGIWAPYHSFSQLYVNLGKILKSNTINRNDVKNLVVTADVIEIEEDIDLSNIDNLVLGCRLFIAGKKGDVPNVKISNKAFSEKKMYCEQMKGNCIFCVDGDVTKRQLVFGDIASSFECSAQTVNYNEFFAGKFPINIFYDSSDEPVNKWIKETLKISIQILLSTASVPISPNFIEGNRNKTTAKEAYKCINWIVNYTEQIVQHEEEKAPQEILSLYASAQQILDKSVNPNITQHDFLPNVPLLKYGTYDNAIKGLLEVSEIYAKQISDIRKEFIERNKELSKEYVQEKRDENIKQIAKFMIDQNNALASKEDDIAKYHNKMVDSKKHSLNQLIEQKNNTEETLNKYLESLEKDKIDLCKAVQKQIKKKEVEASINLAITITECIAGAFSTVVAFKAIGSESGIKKTLQKASAFNASVNLCHKIMTGYYDSKTVASYRKEIATIEDGHKEAPSNLEWKMFLNDVKAQVAPLADICKSATAKYIATLEDVVDIGITYNNYQEQIYQCEKELIAEKENIKIAENQSERLKKLSLNISEPHWSPDNDYYTDLGMFDAYLQQKENDALLKLIEIARLQNDAMTYHYMSKPNSINKFEIMAVRNMLISQELGAISALESYPNPPTDLTEPIEITLENIPTNKLLDELGYEFSINLNEKKFNTYSRVRINYIDIRVNGVKTDSDKCHVKLVSLGSPMHDRGLKRETLSYKTVQKDWNVVYNLKTGKTEIGTKPSEEWKKIYAKQTPFQNYRLSIPKTIENKNITFEKNYTDITIQFFVEAVYSEVYGKSNLIKANNIFIKDCNNDDDRYDFLQEIGTDSITDGWDVVSFISANAINTLWEDRWNKEIDAGYKGERQFLQNIDVTFSSPLFGAELTRHLTMDLLAPLLIFKPHDNKNVNIKIPIKTADLVSTWNGKTETNHYESTPDSPCYLLTECALESLKGSVDKNGGVFIDAFKGTFKFEGITFDPILDANICDCIAEYVKNKDFPSWFLGTIKYQATEEYLKPKNFSFTTYCHEDNSDLDVLGIYILTTKDEPPSHGMRISWNSGWVIGNKCNTAVYFSSHLLWEKEIEPVFEQNFGPMSGKGTDSPNRTFTNSIELCTVEVTVKISEPFSVKHETLNPSVTLPGSQINLNLDLFELKLSCDASWKEPFPYQHKRTYYVSGETTTTYDKAIDDLMLTCKFETSIAPSINQETFEISFPNIQIDPDITAEKPDHGFFWPSGNEIKDTIINRAKERAKGFFSKVNIQLKSMSMFAVSNILFPEGKMLTPEKVAFPHDMVIVGTALNKYKPINKA